MTKNNLGNFGIPRHAWPLFPPKVHEMSGGVISVRLFYIISGYLIAMVLSEKYGSLKNFYFLALRLLPTYLIVLAITLLSSCLFILWRNDPFLLGYLIGYKNVLSSFEIALLSIPQLGILFLDLFGFFGVNENGIHLLLVSWGNTNGYEFLLVPQAWTLGIECWFYLFAPFLIKRSWGLMSYSQHHFLAASSYFGLCLVKSPSMILGREGSSPLNFSTLRWAALPTGCEPT